MARAFFRHIALTLSAGTLLMGCVEGGGKGASKGAGAGLAAPAAARGAAREVEAPEVFQTTDSGLWDGRPSLGGIWVASPDAKDPERVVMFNPATGKTVTGALFRRERDNPGPKLQVSSDAAEALGMLAGQPTEIRVTALRKVEVAEAAPAEPGSADAAATGGKSAPDAAETAALATAALGAADAPAATAPAAVAGEAAVEPAAPEAPKRKTWKERRAEAKARREAEKAAKAAAAVVAPAAGAAAATVVDPAAGAVVAIETAPLDARSAEVAAPEPEKKKTRRQIKAEQEAAAAAAAAAAETPAAPEAPAATAGARPILIASFSKEDNAKRAAEALAKIGITAGTEKSDRDGKAVWGVVASGDATLLDKIKAAGFADAYFLK
ncbi:SPOR domain-containing protein [Tabrizicola soli]|uniref:SPOR domain-containing protein n=1 Tax=Tabrizicola soli TaxID=2185115 RepID=A0ABV7DVA4_9RHOB